MSCTLMQGRDVDVASAVLKCLISGPMSSDLGTRPAEPHYKWVVTAAVAIPTCVGGRGVIPLPTGYDWHNDALVSRIDGLGQWVET